MFILLEKKNLIVSQVHSDKWMLWLWRLKQLDYKDPELCSLSSIYTPTWSANHIPFENRFILKSGKREKRDKDSAFHSDIYLKQQ